MAKKFRKGNDIDITWRVTITRPDGTVIPLTSMSVGVLLCVGAKEFEMTYANSGLTINGNIITFTFFGSRQQYTGSYVLKLFDASNQSVTYDVCNAFILVDHSWEAIDVITIPGSIEVETNVSTSRVIIEQGPKGDKGDPGETGSVPTIGDNGNWWIDGVDTGISAYGKKGNPGTFKSIAFIRANRKPRKPVGGTYDNPIPHDPETLEDWYDGIPAGTELIWASTATFTGSTSASPEWEEPAQMKDSTDFDVEFALVQNNDAKPPMPSDEDTPSGNRHNAVPASNQIWYDPEKDDERLGGDWTHMYWRAERKWVNGVKGNWVVSRIKGETGHKGEEGKKSAIAQLYKRSATKPLAPSDDSEWPNGVSVVYTFGTGEMQSDAPSGIIPSGWSMLGDVPDGSDPIWVIGATAIADANDPDDTIARNEWSDPVQYGIGDGLSCVTVSLYKRSNSNPGAFTRDTYFNFETNTLTYESQSLKPTPQNPDVTIDGWRRYIPNGDAPVWCTQATAIAAGGGNDAIEESEWTPPALVGGENGIDGIKTAVVYMYRRSNTTLTNADKPSGNVTYSFTEKRLLSDLGNWKITVPDGDGAIWIVAATAACPATEDTDVIYATSELNEWSTPALWSKEPINSAPIMLYQRKASVPGGPNIQVSYRFSTAVITADGTDYSPNSTGKFAGGWSRVVPDGDEQCYVTHATALSYTDADDIETSEWSTPTEYVKNGADGRNGSDGSDGSDGPEGISYRVSVWKDGVHYRNDAPDTSLTFRVVDVVTNKDIAFIDDPEFCAFECKLSHTSDEQDYPLPEKDYENTWWKPYSLSDPLVTPLLLANTIDAKYINVNSLTANKLEVKSSGGSTLMYAGDTSYPLLCGSSDPSTAKTKISSTGELTTISGNIAGFQISSNSIGNSSASGTRVALSRSTNGGGLYVGKTTGDYVDISADNQYNNALLHLHAESGLPSYLIQLDAGSIAHPVSTAIYCAEGTFAGLRPRARTVTDAIDTLSTLDYNIYVNKVITTTINLPAKKLEGQTYVIYHGNTTSLEIKSSEVNIYNMLTGNSVNSFTSTQREVIYITYFKDSSKWVLQPLCYNS